MNSIPANTPDSIDPTAIIKQRKERESLEKANALAAKQEQNRALNLEHADEVPGLIDAAVAGIAELYALYKEYDFPALEHATLTTVLDHEATAEKKAQAQNETSKKPSLWERLIPKATQARYQLRPHEKRIISEVSKEVACWMLGSISSPSVDVRLRMFYLEVQTGTVYVTPTSLREGLYPKALDPEMMKDTLSFIEAKEFAELVHGETATVKRNLRWARETT